MANFKINAFLGKIRIKNVSYGQKVRLNTNFDIRQIHSINWLLGDGSTSSSPIVEHIYNKVGTMRIRCIINKRYLLSKKIYVEEPISENAQIFKVINNTDTPVEVVIFQKNVAESFDESIIAWRVLSINQDSSRQLVYEPELKISGSDEFNNMTSKLEAIYGKNFTLSNGPLLAQTGNASSLNEIELLNSLDSGDITANIFRTNRLLGIKAGVSPGNKAVFQFKPTFWIGVVENISEGSIISSDVLSTINTEISLLGIKSADIVITGGDPYIFTLSNVVF